MAVKFPLHTRAWCTPKRARIVLTAIAIIACLYKMPSIFELNLDECGRLKPTQLRNHPLYIIIYNTYGYLLLLLVIPFLIIIILNCIVVNAVREASTRRREMRLQQIRRSCDRKNSETTSMAPQTKAFIPKYSIAGSGGQQLRQTFARQSFNK